MFKSIKEKILRTITSYPKIVTLGIGLAITFATGALIGFTEYGQVFAAQPTMHCHYHSISPSPFGC